MSMNGDVLADGEQDFAVLADETAVDRLGDFFVNAIDERPGLDAFVEVIDKFRAGLGQALMRLGAAHDFE